MRRNILIVVFIGIMILLLTGYELITTPNTLRVTSCDVGQGDATIIRTPHNQTVIIDGGPGNHVLSCLEEQMSFWDRGIDVMILTHPDLDHFEGLIAVLQRYTVKAVLEEELHNDTPEYTAFKAAVAREGAHHKYVYQGSVLKVSQDVEMTVLGPSKAFLLQENPEGMRSNENPPSLILHLQYGQFDALFPGDSDGEDIVGFVPRDFRPELMLVPHHGSKNGFTDEASRIVFPKLAVASLGLKNKYGHPAPQVVERLKKNGAHVYRTDRDGAITLESDGSTYWVKDCDRCRN